MASGATHIGRASVLLASGTMVSRVLGFVKAIVLAQAIGVVGSVSADAFTTSTIVPNSIYAIITQGMLNAVFVPQIVRASRAPDGGRAYINKLVTISLLVFAVIAAAATLLSPALMWFYGVKPEQAELATAFAFWAMPQIFFLGLYTVLGEVLNARKSFGPFTWAPAANNVVGIAMLTTFMVLFGADAAGHRVASDWSPGMIALLAGGATLGIAVQGSLLFFFWRRIGLSFRPDFRWRGVNLGVAGRAALWTFAMLLATQVAGWIETRIANTASGQGASVFAMQTAWLIFMLPHSIITVSVGTAFYTTMSENATSGDRRAFRGNFSQAVRVIALLIVLLQAVLMVVVYPFAAVFIGTGFDAVQQFGWVLLAYLVGLLPFSLQFLSQRAFYSLGDTRTPFLYTLAQAALIVVGATSCLALPPEFRAVGIAGTVTIAGTVQCVLSWLLLRRKLGGFDGRRILASVSRFVVAILAPLALGVATLWMLGGLHEGGFAVSGRFGAIVSMAVVGIVMGLAYLAVLRLLRAPELEPALGPLLARLRRRRGAGGGAE